MGVNRMRFEHLSYDGGRRALERIEKARLARSARRGRAESRERRCKREAQSGRAHAFAHQGTK